MMYEADDYLLFCTGSAIEECPNARYQLLESKIEG
jgi:hypothetical protein